MMNNRVVMGILGAVAAIAVIFAVIQSGNVTQTETKLVAAQNTAAAQQTAFVNQGTAAAATLSAAATQAADSQQKALTDAVNAGATVQANALADAAKAASTLQAQALAAASQAAATAQAKALTDAANSAATAQAQALTDAANVAATAQANSLLEANNSAATQQAHIIATAQAQATATLGAVVDAAATAQVEAVTEALNRGATAQAQASATLEAVINQAATEAAQAKEAYQATQTVLETQIAGLNDQLATAQANAVNPVKPTAAPTQSADVPKDWKRFVGKGVAIQLPNTYTGNELGSDPQTLAKMLRNLGPDFEAGAQLFEQNPDILALIAVNIGGNAGIPSSVIIVSIPMPVNFSVQMMLDATVSQLPKSATVTEKSIVQIGEYEAGRVILETRIGSLVSTQLQYYIISNNNLYLVGFTGTLSGPDSQLDEFEKSMKTFEILAKPGI